MAAPRIEVDLEKVGHNAKTLVDRLAPRGIAVTGVTKAALGWPALARALLAAGVQGLGDSRLANVERLRAAGVDARITLLRSPSAGEAGRVVVCADVSSNSEPTVLKALSAAAEGAGVRHGVLLMVELGDLREGVLPGDVEGAARLVRDLPGLVLHGLGANLACQSGIGPDAANMGELGHLAAVAESQSGERLAVVSGGGSSNLEWAMGGADVGRIDDLRLGEGILLGREPLHRRPIAYLHTDAFTLVGVVIEAKVKPSRPWGPVGETAFGPAPAAPDRGDRLRALVALGHQDTDPGGLEPPAGMTILGASSDHLVIDPGDHHVEVGSEVRFAPGYGALVRAMTSPFVTRVEVDRVPPRAAPSSTMVG
jgi:predicted amino acid racemase